MGSSVADLALRPGVLANAFGATGTDSVATAEWGATRKLTAATADRRGGAMVEFVALTPPTAASGKDDVVGALAAAGLGPAPTEGVAEMGASEMAAYFAIACSGADGPDATTATRVGEEATTR